MMTKDDIIREKLLAQYPESWKIFEESCKYSIKNNLDFIKGILLHRERKIEYADIKSVTEQLGGYLNSLGYNNYKIGGPLGKFFTGENYEEGVEFVVFLSAAAIKSYIKEYEVWENWYKGGRWGTEPKMAIHDAIKYQNIYKS